MNIELTRIEVKNKSINHIFCFLLLLIVSCVSSDEISSKSRPDGKGSINFRDSMRNFVRIISERSKEENDSFIIIPQNAPELLTDNGNPDGDIMESYVEAINGLGLEELFYGQGGDGNPTSKKSAAYLLSYLKKLKSREKSVLVIDYVKSRKQAEQSYRLSKEQGFISYQAERSLSEFSPYRFDINNRTIENLDEAKNFLYLLNTSKFRSPGQFVWKISRTNWDLLVIDAFFWGKQLEAEQVESLKKKAGGGRRLVIAYMSIGEAEVYRYYWKKEWKSKRPPFLFLENPRWKGNYKVKYWHDDWQRIICGDREGNGFDESYLKKIIDAGFDGVYLDIIDAAIYFENQFGTKNY